MTADSTSGSDPIRRLAPLFAIDLVVALALIEPAMGRLKKLGDTLTAKQYLLIMPTGEVSYLIPAVRDVSVPALGAIGAVMLFIGLVPAVQRLRKKGLDAWSALGWIVVLTGLGLLAGEYASKGEWVFMRRIGVRYLASAMVAVGAVLACRDRRFLATCGMGGFAWDLSSAIFWSVLKRDPRATVPVPWFHHFDEEEGRGAPCWLVALVDIAMFSYFAWLSKHDFDPFKFYDE
ncbi:MAG TPA: hypothetical protein VIK02_07440 [Candidatus Anoxymicrobiaceae bacterium]